MPESQVNPRYSKYNNKEIEAILDSVAQVGDIAEALAGKQDTLTFATPAECRAIVTGYSPQQSQPQAQQ